MTIGFIRTCGGGIYNRSLGRAKGKNREAQTNNLWWAASSSWRMLVTEASIQSATCAMFPKNNFCKSGRIWSAKNLFFRLFKYEVFFPYFFLPQNQRRLDIAGMEEIGGLPPTQARSSEVTRTYVGWKSTILTHRVAYRRLITCLSGLKNLLIPSLLCG